MHAGAGMPRQPIAYSQSVGSTITPKGQSAIIPWGAIGYTVWRDLSAFQAAFPGLRTTLAEGLVRLRPGTEIFFKWPAATAHFISTGVTKGSELFDGFKPSDAGQV
jgi:hypothetical protein